MKNDIKMYALSAAHYIIENLPDWTDKIDSVILFGSVAQDRAYEESDVDIFFDVDISKRAAMKLKSDIRKVVSEFRLSQNAMKFKMKGICNEISVLVGKLDDWTDLKMSISATGIILYGKYKTSEKSKGLKHHVILSWDATGKNRGAFLNKIYGYHVGKKSYEGMIKKYKGRKIGKSSAMIPIEHSKTFFDVMKKYGIGCGVVEVWV